MAHYSDPNAGLSVAQTDGIQPIAVCVAVAALIAVAFSGLFYFKKTSLETTNSQLESSIAKQDAQLKDLEPTVADLQKYDNQALALHTVFDNQKNWETVLGRIETVLYKKMKVTDFQLSDTGTFTLSGSTPSYQDYAGVYAAMTGTEAAAFFQTVKVTSIAKSDKEGATDVSFGFKGTLTPEALKQK